MQVRSLRCRLPTLPFHLSIRAPARQTRSFIVRPRFRPSAWSAGRHDYRALSDVGRFREFSQSTKGYFKYQGKVLLYGIVVTAIVLGTGTVFLRLLQKDWLDKLFPTPKEWWWLPRSYYRMLKHAIESTDGENADWSMVARASLESIKLLEDGWEASPYGNKLPGLPVPEKWGPAPIKKQYDWDRTVPGMEDKTEMLKHPGGEQWDSKIGPDISMMPEAWRRAYVELHMLAAKACEMRAGCLTLKGPRKIVYRPEYVLSDQNPYPLDLPPNSRHPNKPHIDDCHRAFPSPDQAYTRLLTMKGATRSQRIEAGIAYAGWLAATGRDTLAEQMHWWTLDMALEGIDSPNTIIDRDTGIIKTRAPYITENILHTTSALAEYLARHGQISHSLNIYLSMLRARQNSSEAPRSSQYSPQSPDYSLTSTQSIIAFLKHLPWEGQYPSPPPSGDDPFLRARSKQCEEAAIISHVAEILFARSDRKEQALQFVQDATDMSQAGFHDRRLTRKEWKICESCLQTSLISWADMLDVIVDEKIKRGGNSSSGALASRDSKTSTSQWLYSFIWSPSKIDEALLSNNDWEAERVAVRQRLAKHQERKLLELEKGNLRPFGQG